MTCLRSYSWATAGPGLLRQNVTIVFPGCGQKAAKRPSRFLKDSLILGDEPPSSAFLGNALVWVILPPEHKRTLWLWFQGSDVYLSLNTKPKSECLVTLAESEAAAAVHSRSAHSCAISALNPLSLCGIYSFFFFFLIHLGPIICFVKNQAL